MLTTMHQPLFRAGTAILPAAACLFAVGCATPTVTTTTTVNAEGAFTRKIVFEAPKDGKHKDAGLTTLRRSFEMPAGGPWKTQYKRGKAKDSSVYTAERTLTPGSVQRQNIAIKSDNPAQPGLVVLNEATVRSVGPGRWEYRETLHWNGRTPDYLSLVRSDPRILPTIKSSLPPALATEANVRPIALTLSREMWRVVFGPSEFNLLAYARFADRPEVIDRKIVAQISPALETAISTQVGDALTPEERSVCVRKILGIVVENLNVRANAPPTKAGPVPDFGDAAQAELTFSVKLPGKIVSTNGTRNAATHEVSWFFAPQSSALGDVEMTAVCDTNGLSTTR